MGILGILGLGVGKVDLQLPKKNFHPGETISGKATLKLSKNVKATGFYIRLYGLKEYYSNGKRQRKTVFDFKDKVDGKREYKPGEKTYPFEINIPGNILSENNQITQALGTAIKVMRALSSKIPGSGYTKWYLEAYLDVPMQFDVKKKVEINIG